MICHECGERPAVKICAQCAWEEEGWLCAECAPHHGCNEEDFEYFLPVVNSPRAGVCAYVG